MWAGASRWRPCGTRSATCSALSRTRTSNSTRCGSKAGSQRQQKRSCRSKRSALFPLRHSYALMILPPPENNPPLRRHTLSEHSHRIGIHRREFLQVGYSGLLGIGLSSLLAQRAKANAPSPPTPHPGRRTPKSVIIVFLTGAPSHLDTFDLKPDAPAEIRGEFRPLATSVPGLHVSEHLP